MSGDDNGENYLKVLDEFKDPITESIALDLVTKRANKYLVAEKSSIRVYQPGDKSSIYKNNVMDPTRLRYDYRIGEILERKKTSYEIKFNKAFRIVTTSVEYKAQLFYQRIKLIIESNRICGYEYHDSNKLNVNEVFNPYFVLNFDQLTCGIAAKQNSKKFRIMVLGYEQTFKFKVSSKEIYENILIHLNYYIESSLGRKNNLLGISLHRDFYKFYYFFEKQFQEKAKTGDLLIFRGFECPAKCQRVFTGAHYDHIALLVKKNDTLHVYESTSKDVNIKI